MCPTSRHRKLKQGILFLYKSYVSVAAHTQHNEEDQRDVATLTTTVHYIITWVKLAYSQPAESQLNHV